MNIFECVHVLICVYYNIFLYILVMRTLLSNVSLNLNFLWAASASFITFFILLWCVSVYTRCKHLSKKKKKNQRPSLYMSSVSNTNFLFCYSFFFQFDLSGPLFFNNRLWIKKKTKRFSVFVNRRIELIAFECNIRIKVNIKRMKIYRNCV